MSIKKLSNINSSIQLKKKQKKDTDKLRIAYFLWHFPVPSETFVLNELRFLVNAGYDVMVFYYESPYKDFKIDFEIKCCIVKTPESFASELKKYKRTIVHSHFVFPSVTYMSWKACELAQIPFTFITHALDLFKYRNIRINRIKEIVSSQMNLRVFVPGSFHRKFLNKLGVVDNKIITNAQAIDFHSYSKTSKNKKRLSICTISRFVEKKGIKYLIQASKILEPMGITIDIYGYGNLEASYRDQIQKEKIKNVNLKGSIKGKNELIRILHSYDLYVSPCVRARNGDMDGIPTIIMEAMAARIPVLTTTVSSIPDLVKDNITGFLCRPKNKKDLARVIKEFYSVDKDKLQYILNNAQKRVEEMYSINKSINTLVHVWRKKKVDIIIVSYQNLSKLKEVVKRIMKYTSTFYTLTIVDNNSKKNVKNYLQKIGKKHENINIILLDKNIIHASACNIAIKNGTSENVIYVCANEGFIMQYNWERKMLEYMEDNPKVGLAGTISYSPSYFDGKAYKLNNPYFINFRNKKYIEKRLNKPMVHVQGGLFILRRKMYESIGGFSETIPYNSTDVEYSYYAQSSGWNLGDISNILAVNKNTLPSISSRFNENVLAAYPLSLKSIKHYERIINTKIKKCNICGWTGNAFKNEKPHVVCPKCLSLESHRSLFNYFVCSNLTYRKLKCLDLNPHPSLKTNFVNMFKYTPHDISITNNLNDIEKNRMDIIILMNVDNASKLNKKIFTEIKMKLRKGGFFITQKQNYKHIKNMGFDIEYKSYVSKVFELDWNDILVCTKK